MAIFILSAASRVSSPSPDQGPLSHAHVHEAPISLQQSFTPPSEVLIGFQGPLDYNANSNARDGGFAACFTFNMALSEINNKTKYPNLLPSTRLVSDPLAFFLPDFHKQLHRMTVSLGLITGTGSPFCLFSCVLWLLFFSLSFLTRFDGPSVFVSDPA